VTSLVELVNWLTFSWCDAEKPYTAPRRGAWACGLQERNWHWQLSRENTVLFVDRAAIDELVSSSWAAYHSGGHETLCLLDRRNIDCVLTAKYSSCYPVHAYSSNLNIETSYPPKRRLISNEIHAPWASYRQGCQFTASRCDNWLSQK
jgi:hypothetical protein